MGREVKFGLRMLRRAPLVTVVAVASLALGVGANTAVFTLMEQILLDYLPVPAPNQLALLHNQEPESGHVYSNGMNSSFSYPLYRDLNTATGRIFQGILAFRSIEVSVSGHDSTENVQGELVSGNYFDVMKVSPWRGRLLNATDDTKPGGSPIAVLSYGFWKRRFGGDPGVVNRTIIVNSHPYTVVGVAPPQFYGTDLSSRAEIFVPMCMKSDVVLDTHALNERLDHWASLIARLRPGVTAEQAAAALGTIYPALRDQDLAFMKSPGSAFRKVFLKKRILLTPGGKGYTEIRDELSEPLQLLMWMVGVVLLITVVNIANLLVARAVARRREMAIRLSVGADAAALTRQLLTESLLLAALGGIAGVLLAYNGTPMLVRLISFDLNATSISAQPDWRVLLFASAITMAAGVALGLLPSWQSTRTEVSSELAGTGGVGNSSRYVWLRRGLVIAQVAFSLVLVTAAILFTRSLRNLQNIDAGFNTRHLVKFTVNPLQNGYSQARIKSFGEDLRTRLASLPGVESAAIATVPLLEDDTEGGDVTVEGQPERSGDEGTADRYHRNGVSPGYFATMQIPLLAGRQFRADDASPTSNVVVVNKTFAKQFLAGKNAIGMHLGFGHGNLVKLDHTIIGVVEDSKHATLREHVMPFVYLPYLADQHLSALNVYVRTRSDEHAVMPQIRVLMHQFDPTLAVTRMASMQDIIDESLFAERGLGFLSAGFALLATILAVVGLYGVMSYSVTRRYRELGIRMAVGATPGRVLGMVLRESISLGVAGVACALPFVFAAAGYVRSSLYGIQPDSASGWLTAALLLISVALIAGLVPGFSAARVDPHAALRSE
jgi:predicted permease